MFSRKLHHLFYKINTNAKFCKSNLSMSNAILREIFLKSVESVQPARLIKHEVKLKGDHLLVRGQSYEICKPCYVVGFGKAVLGMATEIESVLGDRLQRGVVTVPMGIFEKYTRPCGSRIEYFEGAMNNLPDKNAEKGAMMIKELVVGLGEDDLLIVLISGGGSALLPLPVPPITLEEKIDVIKKLAKRGADIRELNALRQQISVLKGGGLAEAAHPCKIISLVLSDIVGDPLDFIASGPTIPNGDSAESAVQVLKKYHLYEEIPDSIKLVLHGTKDRCPGTVVPVLNGEYEHVKNYVIGNNTIAAEAARGEALNKGFQSVIVSTEIDGDVNEISKIYAGMARYLAAAISDPANKDNLKVFLENVAEALRAKRGFVEEVLDMDFARPICLIFAGEPTVVVTGSGRGGRNQQLALAYSVEVNKLGIKSADISFLSCGTDGIDGPTDAAGATATCDFPGDRPEDGVDPEHYLDNNDSYGFYEKYNRGNNLVKIGHTGTNVMDVHVMVIAPRKGMK